MQSEAQRQEQIKAKMRELAELKAQIPEQPIQNEPAEDLSALQQELYDQHPEQPQQKYYDIEQLLVAMWTETVTSIAVEVPMSDFKRSRLLMIRDKLLLEMDLTELIPREQEPQREPESTTTRDEEIERAVDDIVEPKFGEANRDLDTISQKMKDIDSKDGLMHPEAEPEEQSGLQRILGSLGGGKKKPVERTVDEKHQPSSMG